MDVSARTLAHTLSLAFKLQLNPNHPPAIKTHQGVSKRKESQVTKKKELPIKMVNVTKPVFPAANAKEQDRFLQNAVISL